MNFLGKRKRRRGRAAMWSEDVSRARVYSPSLRAGRGMNFPFICIPFSAGRTFRSDGRDCPLRHETTKSDPHKYRPIRASVIQSGVTVLRITAPAILDGGRTDRLHETEWSESFLLRKRSENTIILVSAMRKRERDAIARAVLTARRRIQRDRLSLSLFFFCNRAPVSAVSSHFSSRGLRRFIRWYVRPVSSTSLL